MVFGCPICAERLDRVPGAHVASTGNDGGGGDINISSTPCGHIFHTFCIQKWLTGSLASSKQCPCCRKGVPGCKTLPLFPDRFDLSLDDSVDATGSGAPFCDHSHFNHQLNILKTTTEKLRGTLAEKDLLYEIQCDVSKDMKAKYEREKERSETYMFKWKQLESYKDFAEEKEREGKAATDKLKQYQLIDAMVKNVQEDVKYELERYTSPCNSNSLQKLLEIHHVIQGEYDSASKKLKDVQVKQETDRQEISRLRKKYSDLLKAHAELSRVHSNCSDNSFVTGTTPRDNKMNANVMNNNTRTPLLLPSKTSKSSQPKAEDDGGDNNVDSDVLVIRPFNKKKQALSKRGLDKLNSDSQSSSQSSSVSQNQDDVYQVHSTTSFKKLKSGIPASTTKASSLDSLSPKKSGTIKPKKCFPSSLLDAKQPSSSSLKPTSVRSKEHNETILVFDSDEDDDLLDIPLRGNIPGLKIERRQTQAQSPRKFTFKKKT